MKSTVPVQGYIGIVLELERDWYTKWSMKGYGQFCPIAKAAELLDQRWTLLILRELMCGSQQFNEIRRGVPKMSPTLLSRRLRDLVRYGIAVKTPDGRYLLTPAGKELQPLVELLGTWGTRWMPDLGDPDLDPHLLMWDIRRSVDLTALPTGRTVVQVVFGDLPGAGREWWLVLTRDGADTCDFDPGYEVAARLEVPLPIMTAVWRGDVSWAEARRRDQLRVSGSFEPRWFLLSKFAPVERPEMDSPESDALGHDGYHVTPLP
ncbi:DNA-binding HxlR family transcriptional regulator [Nonomuraea soli]|uniref:DNA-binding HxlR family transcriptional regulator n=2 Tax=Nonomuraea soli TaxID=1032476 RepID=A0A7W0CRB3_9ACTN|nr:DNA-binding HxlR family transcriptional regulator [Nonomuraea soli]